MSFINVTWDNFDLLFLMDDGGHGGVDEELFSLRLGDWQDCVNETSYKQEVKRASLNSFYHSRKRSINLRRGSF